jgi:hypothetical protein
LPDVWLAKIFSHSVGGLFNLGTNYLLCRSFLISWSPVYQSFLLVAEILGVVLRKSLPIPIVYRVFPALSCTSFKI